MRASATLLIAAILGCSDEPRVWPSRVSQHGGVQLHVEVPTHATGGAVVVLVDEIPTRAVVIDAPGKIQVELPSLPNIGWVDVEVLYADGTTVALEDVLEVTSVEFEVRARE